MGNMIQEILLSPFGSFASVLSLFITVIYIVHWATKKVTEIRTSQEKIENSVDAVYKRIDGRVDKIEGHIDNIRNDIAYLKARTEIFQADQRQAVAQRKSPVSLTELGQKIYADLNAEEMIAKSWQKICEAIETNMPNKNAYDIQQYIFDTATISLETFLEKEDVDKVKLFAFKEGRPLAFYSLVFGIPIRDSYLKLKGIDIAEVDKPSL
jgi:hypothetical protein